MSKYPEPSNYSTSVLAFTVLMRCSPVVWIAVWRVRDVLNDRRYPHCCESHALDIIQLVGNALPCSSTVIAPSAGLRGR